MLFLSVFCWYFLLGSGISPIKALIESGDLAADKRSDVRLYYGTRDAAHTAYADRISAWEAAGVKVIQVGCCKAGLQPACGSSAPRGALCAAYPLHMFRGCPFLLCLYGGTCSLLCCCLWCLRAWQHVAPGHSRLSGVPFAGLWTSVCPCCS